MGFELAFCLLYSSRIVRSEFPWTGGYSLSYLRLSMDDERTRVSLTSRSSESVPADFLTVRLPRASYFGNHSPAQVHRRVSALLRGSGNAAPRDVLDPSSLLSLLPPALCALAGAPIGMTPHASTTTVASHSVAPLRAGSGSGCADAVRGSRGQRPSSSTVATPSVAPLRAGPGSGYADAVRGGGGRQRYPPRRSRDRPPCLPSWPESNAASSVGKHSSHEP